MSNITEINFENFDKEQLVKQIKLLIKISNIQEETISLLKKALYNEKFGKTEV